MEVTLRQSVLSILSMVVLVAAASAARARADLIQ
jgi:hypothetical protein